MGRKIICGVVCTAFLLCCRMAPDWFVQTLPRVRVVHPGELEYADTVSCRGTLISAENREITLELPVITRNVQAAVGDRVTAGQVLASVDRERTLDILTGGGWDASLAELDGLLAKYGETELARRLEQLLADLTETGEREGLTLPENIVAPIDGVVVAASASNDRAVTPLEPAFVLSPETGMEASVLVREVDIARVRVGQRGEIACTAMPGKVYAARVRSIAPSAVQRLSGSTSETFVEVILTLEQPDSFLRDGYNVRATLQTEEPRRVTLIPYGAAEQDESGTEYVYLLQKGRTVRREVALGECLAEGERVLSGIDCTDWVVLQPETVEEGALVRAEYRGDAE